MKIVRYIISTILSFLIILAVFLLMGIDIIDNKILDKEYIISKLDEVEFYLQISREAENGFENYIYQSGLPEDTIKDLFTEEMIKADVKSLIDCLYEGTDIKLSDEMLRNNLDTKIQEYLNSQKKELNAEGKKNIKKFEDLIVKEYKDNVNVSTTFYKKGNTILEKINNIRNKIGAWPFIIAALLVILIILININDLILAINFISISSISIGILLKLGINLIFKNIDLDNLIILSKSLSSLINSIAKECLYGFSENANTFIICGIIGILTVSILTNTNKKSNRPKRRFVYNKETV